MGEMDVWDDAGLQQLYRRLPMTSLLSEPSNGWATELGDGDRMAGTGAPYSGGATHLPHKPLWAPMLTGVRVARSPTIRQTTVSLSS